jgi:hypothetical protein
MPFSGKNNMGIERRNASKHEWSNTSLSDRLTGKIIVFKKKFSCFLIRSIRNGI